MPKINSTDEKLPVFELAVDSDTDDLSGLSIVSIVADPAIQQRFQTFANADVVATTLDQDRHLVMGPALVPNVPIYRRDQTGEYYVTFTPTAIETMVHKYHDNRRSNNSSFEHNGDLLNGITMVENYIVDRSRGVMPNANYPNLKDGTWFVTFKVNNAEVWQAIKSGQFTGFSVEGLFNHIATTTKFDAQAQTSSNRIYKGTSSNLEKNLDPTVDKLFAAISDLQKTIIAVFTAKGKFGEAMLVDLSKISFEGPEIEVGNRVWLEDPSGNVSVLSDGDYLVKDTGGRFSIEDGFVKTCDPGQRISVENPLLHQAQSSEDNGTFEDQFPPKAEDLAKDPKKPYGDVPYADPGTQKDKVHRYPIDTEEHIRAAWNYINKGNASGDVAAIKKRIISAWKSKIDPKGPPSARK